MENKIIIKNMSKEKFEALIARILRDGGFPCNVTVEIQTIDSKTKPKAIINLEVIMNINGSLNDPEMAFTNYT